MLCSQLKIIDKHHYKNVPCLVTKTFNSLPLFFPTGPSSIVHLPYCTIVMGIECHHDYSLGVQPK